MYKCKIDTIFSQITVKKKKSLMPHVTVPSSVTDDLHVFHFCARCASAVCSVRRVSVTLGVTAVFIEQIIQFAGDNWHEILIGPSSAASSRERGAGVPREARKTGAGHERQMDRTYRVQLGE